IVMEHNDNHAQNKNNDKPLHATGYLADFKGTYPEEELEEKLEDAFDQHTSQIVLHEVAKIASEHDPIDLAHAVTKLPPSSRIVVYDNLPDMNAKIIFMIHTGNN